MEISRPRERWLLPVRNMRISHSRRELEGTPGKHIGNITKWSQRDEFVSALGSHLHCPGSFTGSNIQNIERRIAEGRPKEWVLPLGLQDQGDEMSSINEWMRFWSGRGSQDSPGFICFKLRVIRGKAALAV